MADYEAGRVHDARNKLLQVARDYDRIEPEALEYLYVIAKYEEPKDPAAAETWRARYVESVRQLAEAGSTRWQLKLATMCQFGDRLPVDHSYARATFAKLAEAGNAEAQFRYAGMHKSGQCGLPVDETAYVQWLERAADNGFPEAQHEFAVLLLSGTSVTRAERSKALLLLRHAADAGFDMARATLAELHVD